jgi:hypothetical protein
VEERAAYIVRVDPEDGHIADLNQTSVSTSGTTDRQNPDDHSRNDWDRATSSSIELIQ